MEVGLWSFEVWDAGVLFGACVEFRFHTTLSPSLSMYHPLPWVLFMIRDRTPRTYIAESQPSKRKLKDRE